MASSLGSERASNLQTMHPGLMGPRPRSQALGVSPSSCSRGIQRASLGKLPPWGQGGSRGGRRVGTRKYPEQSEERTMNVCVEGGQEGVDIAEE